MELAGLPNQIEVFGVGSGFPITHYTGSEFHFHWVPKGELDDYSDIVVQMKHIYNYLKEGGFKTIPTDPLELLIGLTSRLPKDNHLAELVNESLGGSVAYQHRFYEGIHRPVQLVLASSHAFFLNKLFASVSIVNDKDWLRSKLQIKFRNLKTNELNNEIVSNLLINGSNSPFYDQFSEATNLLVNQMIDRKSGIIEDGFNLSVLGKKDSVPLTLLLATLGLDTTKVEEHENGVDYEVKFIRLLD